MRKILNKLFYKFHYRIERIPLFSILLDRLEHTHGKPKFIQVGANDGVRFDGLYQYVTERSCQGIVIEPLPDIFENLKRNYQDYRGVTPINIAIHPILTEATIYRVDPTMVSDLAPWVSGIASFNRHHLEKSGVPSHSIISESVPCTPLMPLIEKYDMLDATLLQIDTEGFDAEIIDMIDFNRFKPKLIKYEHKHLGEHKAVSTQMALRQHGYITVSEGGDTLAYSTDLRR